MSDAIAPEKMEFRVVSPKVPMPGLDALHERLQGIHDLWMKVNASMANLSTGSLFKRTQAELKDIFGRAAGSNKTISVEQAAAAAGIPNLKDFQAYIARWKSSHKELFRQVFSGGGAEFRTLDKAAEFTQKYFTSALRNARNPIEAMQAAFGKGGSSAPAAGPITASVSGPIQLIIPASQIVARVEGAVAASGGGAGGSAGGGGKGKLGPLGELPGGEGGATTLEKLTEGKNSRRFSRKELVKLGEEVETFFKQVENEFEQIKTVTTKNPVKKAQEKFRAQLSELQRNLTSALGGELNPTEIAKLYRRQAELLRSLAGGKNAAQLKELGLGSLADRTLGLATGFESRATTLDAKTQAKAAETARRQEKESEKLRTQMAAAARKDYENLWGQLLKEKDLSQSAAMKDAERRAKQDVRNQRARDRASENLGKLMNQEALGALSEAEGHQLLNALKASGFNVEQTKKSGNRARGTASTTYTATKDDGGRHYETQVRFNFKDGKAVSADVSELNRKLKETRAEAGALGGDFVRNTAKVVTWAASVGVLYKTIELASTSMRSLIDSGVQMARLDQVFTKIGGSTMDLTRDTIALAAANGRSRQEAMESAIQWSRLGLTRAQVNEAVRTSLIAANIAEISSAEATDKLSSIMMAYSLRVSDLRTVMAELNAVSNTFNVTNADMLEGLTRTAAVAKQARVPLSELIGMVGATVGGTGQSGATVGNMLKTVMSRLSDANLQKEMRQQFKIEVTAEGGSELKSFSQILAEMFVRYQDLSSAQRQSLLFQTAGATQVNRLQALLDNYVRAQVLAINAQLNLNSAERENEKIKATLRNQLQGLTSEWERFVAIQGSRGPAQALGGISETFRNVLALMNTGAGSGIATGFLAMLTAASAKVALVGLQMKSTAGSAGFLGQTMKRVAEAAGALNTISGSVIASFVSRTQANRGDTFLGLPTGRAMAGVGSATNQINIWAEASLRAANAMKASGAAGAAFFRVMGVGLRTLAVATAALSEFIAPMIVFWAASKMFNAGMEAIGLSSDKANARLAGFNEEVAKAREGANAFAQASNLFRTAGRALDNMRDPKARARFIEQINEVAFLGEEDDAARKQKQDALTREMQLLDQQGRGAENKARWEKISLEYVREETSRRAEAVARTAQAASVAREELKRLKDADASWYGRFGRNSRRTAIAAKEREAFELDDEGVKLRNAETAALERRLDADDKHLTSLERQKMALESIAEIYRMMAPDSRGGAARMQIVGNEAQVQALQRQRDQLNEQLRAFANSGQANGLESKQISDQLKQKQVELNRLMGMSPKEIDTFELNAISKGKLSLFGTDMSKESHPARIQALRDEIVALKTRGDALANMIPIEEQSARKQLQLTEEKIRALNRESEALRSTLQLRDTADRIAFGQRQAGLDVTPFDVGPTDIDRILNRRKAAIQQMHALMQDPGALNNALSLAKIYGLQNQIMQDGLELRMRVVEAEREINQIMVDRNKEFRNSLLMSGPGELLRKLAAMRMNSRGVGMGQFLTLGGGMRQDLMNLNPGQFDPRVWDLRRAIQNAGPQLPDEQFFKGQKEFEQALLWLAGHLKNFPNLVEVATATGQLATEARNAAAALGQFPGLLINLVDEVRAYLTQDGNGGGLTPRDASMLGLQLGMPMITPF